MTRHLPVRVQAMTTVYVGNTYERDSGSTVRNCYV